LYEDLRNWEAARLAYVKALEVASPNERAAAEADLRRVLEKDASFWDGYLNPFWSRLYDRGESWLLTLIAGLTAVAIVWVVLRVGGRIGKSRGKNKLFIGDFVDATTINASAVFTEVLKNAFERVQEYYRPRDRFRLGAWSAMTLVESPEPGALAELMSAIVSAESGKVWSLVRKSFFKPAYRVRGTFQCVQRRYRLWLRLQGPGGIVEAWDREFPASQYGTGQEQLAYEIAMFVKERGQTHGNE
jgi:hypothetical protein